MLQDFLDTKQSLLSDVNGVGVSLIYGTKLRTIYGTDGIDVSIYLGAINDLSNYQIKISGSQIYNQLNSQLNSSEISNYYTITEVSHLINNVSGSINVDTSLFVLKSGSVMSGDLTTSGDIQSRDLIATRELHGDGAAF